MIVGGGYLVERKYLVIVVLSVLALIAAVFVATHTGDWSGVHLAVNSHSHAPVADAQFFNHH